MRGGDANESLGSLKWQKKLQKNRSNLIRWYRMLLIKLLTIIVRVRKGMKSKEERIWIYPSGILHSWSRYEVLSKWTQAAKTRTVHWTWTAFGRVKSTSYVIYKSPKCLNKVCALNCQWAGRGDVGGIRTPGECSRAEHLQLALSHPSCLNTNSPLTPYTPNCCHRIMDFSSPHMIY